VIVKQYDFQSFVSFKRQPSHSENRDRVSDAIVRRDLIKENNDGNAFRFRRIMPIPQIKQSRSHRIAHLRPRTEQKSRTKLSFTATAKFATVTFSAQRND
jgi:hypothetical protein